MQANVNIRFVSWFFLAAISQHLCCVTVGSPLKSTLVDKVDLKECERLSKALLSKVNGVLTRDNLSEGFNCTEQRMKIDTNVFACELNTEQEAGCSGSQNTRFNQNECLKNITANLEYYRNKLSTYQREELSSTVVQAIQNLLESLNFPSPPKDFSTPLKKNFDLEMRLSLCKELKGFHTRTITINRIMGYMAAVSPPISPSSSSPN